MTILGTLVTSGIVSILFFSSALIAIHYGWLRLTPGKVEMRVAELTRELNQERSYREQLEERVDFLVSELQKAGARIRELEQTALLARPPDPAKPSALPAKPLLIICGDDQDLCTNDRQALRRAGVPFQRLTHATKQSIADELRRRRQSGNLYPWVHIPAHANAVGIALADGVAEPGWWHEQLDGIRVVFLAACQTSSVADVLAGLVTVVFVYEDIDDRDASDFTYAFWRRMQTNGDPVAAYQAAIIEVPTVAEFTDIRSQ